MNEHEPTPVDTSKDSTDTRIGPDGKITDEQKDHLIAKAVRNTTKDLISRVDKIGGDTVYEEDGKFVVLGKLDERFRDPKKLTHYDGVKTRTHLTKDQPQHRYTETMSAIDQNRGNVSTAFSIKQPNEINDEDDRRSIEILDLKPDGKRNISFLGTKGMDRKQIAQTAIDVLSEQRKIVSAAERIVQSRQEEHNDN